MIPISAPTYPPAAGFEAPALAPRPLTVRNYSTAELMQMPEAWAIVLKHMPALKMMTGASQAKAMLTTMTVADFAFFAGRDASAQLAAIDAELAQLPAAQLPSARGGAR
jgi:hypothetical protein